MMDMEAMMYVTVLFIWHVLMGLATVLVIYFIMRLVSVPRHWWRQQEHMFSNIVISLIYTVQYIIISPDIWALVVYWYIVAPSAKLPKSLLHLIWSHVTNLAQEYFVRFWLTFLNWRSHQTHQTEKDAFKEKIVRCTPKVFIFCRFTGMI